jgi:sulfopyruvate decarboxylase TPP-binding subunit
VARDGRSWQSSGLANSLDALGSLFIPDQIPVRIIVSMYGEAGDWNAASGATWTR